MAIKLKYADIENNEVALSKFKFDGASTLITTTVNVYTTGIPPVPQLDLTVGSLVLDPNGNLYVNRGADPTYWDWLSSITTSIPGNRIPRFSGPFLYTSITYSSEAFNPAGGDIITALPIISSGFSSDLLLRRSYHCSTGGGELKTLGENDELLTFVFGGVDNTSGPRTSTEYYEGTTWTLGGNLNLAKVMSSAGGSGYSAWVSCGAHIYDFSTFRTNTELYSGSAWVNGANSIRAKRSSSGWGPQTSGIMVAGQDASGTLTTSEYYNGSAWFTASSLINIPRGSLGPSGGGKNSFSGLLTAGGTTSTEVFNGSSWTVAGNTTVSRIQPGAVGDAFSFLLIYGEGFSSMENFNGSVWASSGTGVAASDSHNGSAGSSNKAFITGGNVGGDPATSISKVTKIRQADASRGRYSYKNFKASNGYSLNMAGQMSQGSSVDVDPNDPTTNPTTYPPNKYLVVNRSMDYSPTVLNSYTKVDIASVLNTSGTNYAYNFVSSVTLNQVIPGMIAISSVTSAGQLTANRGSFVISKVVNPSSIEIANSSGVNDNPTSGYLVILTTMLAVDEPGPTDTVIGKTDSYGLLTIPKLVTVGSVVSRSNL